MFKGGLISMVKKVSKRCCLISPPMRQVLLH